MVRLAIIGAGDLGKQIAYYAEADKQFNVVGFFDDTITKGLFVNDKVVLGSISEVVKSFKKNNFDVLLIAVGYKHMGFRKQLFNELHLKVPFATFVHSSVHRENSSRVGAGSIIFPGVIIDHNVNILENVLVNIGCSVSHDTVIGHHSFLSPRVAIAGFCAIGAQNILGINSTIIDNIKTVDSTQLGAGTVLINTIEKKGLYVGNPSRFIK
jgi:sugar O-acyltransferase (sialic acid O-acetyltransferase NeuD family)